MKKKITAFVLVAALATAGLGGGLSLLTFELSLPGGATNEVSLTYPGRASVVAPVLAFAPDTNGVITVKYYSAAVPDGFSVGGFASGSRTFNMASFPPIRYGESYKFTSSVTNAGTVLVTGEIANP